MFCISLAYYDQDGDGWKYAGRGIIQVTGKGNFNKISGLDYMTEYRVNTPNELLDKEKGTIYGKGFWRYKGLNITANYLNQPTHVDVCSYIVKGEIHLIRRKNFKGFKKSGWDFKGTAQLFEVEACEYGSPYFAISGRAPWMDVAIAQAKEAKGVKEWGRPLHHMGIRYHAYANVRTGKKWNIPAHPGKYHKDKEGTAWCASFVSWCLGQTDYESYRSGSSQFPVEKDIIENNKKFKKIDDPIYGAVVVFKNHKTNSGAACGHGHITFLHGKTPEGDLLCLGGNQGNSIKISKYKAQGTTNTFKESHGEVNQKFHAFYIPKNYEVTEADKLSESDIFISSKEANERLMNLELNTEEGESTL